MKCPVCENPENEILDVNHWEYSPACCNRIWECPVCESVWLEAGREIEYTIPPNYDYALGIEWEGEAYEIDYGWNSKEIVAQNELKKFYQAMFQRAQELTLPMFTA